MDVEVLHAGMFTTVQDLGRSHYQQYGVPVGGDGSKCTSDDQYVSW